MTNPSSSDFLPLIPGHDGGQRAVRPLREAFQDLLDGKLYPKSVARNIINYQVDPELNFKGTADRVLKIHADFVDELEILEGAADEVLNKYGSYMVQRAAVDSVEDLKERIRLKHCDLFALLSTYYVDNFGLLQKNDILPDVIERYLNFNFSYDHHMCEECVKKSRTLKAATTECGGMKRRVIKPEPKKPLSIKKSESSFLYSKSNLQEQKYSSTGPFTVIPKEVVFRNCELNKTYKKKVRLLNRSTSTQALVVKSNPESRSLSVDLDVNSKIASGMSCYATITFKPEIHRNFQDVVSFRNQKGHIDELKIQVSRTPPRLIICIFNNNDYPFDRSVPGSQRFNEKRREALNSSVDCGSCMIGEYISLSLFVQNKGLKGKFFIITEDEWYFENIESISTCMEYTSDSLWIYPTFFELGKDESTEIDILFHPIKEEMYLEKFYIMCDNNTFQQFEVIGDGMTFHPKMIKIDVPPNDVEVNNKEGYCIFLGDHDPHTTVPLTLTVHNTSSLLLKCEWKLHHNKVKGIYLLEGSWVERKEAASTLIPYSTTDFEFKINFNTTVEGYYNIFFNLFVFDVPMLALEQDEKYLIMEKQNENNLIKCVDVQIMDIEVAGHVNYVEETPASSLESDTAVHKVYRQKIGFSCFFLDFGILPNGLSAQKSFWVCNFSKDYIKWRLVEVKYNIDSPPHMEVIHSKNITCDNGEFSCTCDKRKIHYNVTKKGPLSWVSMLLLLLEIKDNVFEIQSICIVTYQIINYDITLNDSENPVICPMRIMYTGVPHTLKITVQNHSLITGLFYFLKPYGSGTRFVDVDIKPKYGIIKPLKTKSVDVRITSNDVGIFEDIYIPCFINRGQDCLIVRVLCAVDSIHLTIYLPDSQDYHQKIMWPPKILFEFDDNWMICPCTMEYSATADLGEAKNTNKEGTTPFISNIESYYRPGNNTPNESKEVLIAEKSLSGSKTNTEFSSMGASKSSNESSGLILKDTLQDKFGEDLFLQDYVVEIHQVQLRTPTKVTFYLENITPISTNYTVEATNFLTTKSFDKVAVKLKLKKAEDIWNDMIMNDYGILVLPDVKETYLPGFGVMETTLTIFANTWGIYQEEIAVDIPDIPCFTFSLLIEVVGCPIVFPIAVKRTAEVPTLRLGNIAYCSEEIQRKIIVKNTSCVPLRILWHTFVKSPYDEDYDMNFNLVFDMTSKDYLSRKFKLDFTDKYYGRESNQLFTMFSKETTVKKHSTEFLNVLVRPEEVPSRHEKTNVKCSIIGRILLKEEHRKKPNYFFRPINTEDKNCAIMEVLFTLELALLKPDFICGETKIYFYANEVVFNSNFRKRERLVFQNYHECSAEVEMSIEDPFEILPKNKEGKVHRFVVQALSHLEIDINCKINHQEILRLSEKVYPKRDFSLEDISYDTQDESVDMEHRILHIQKQLKILQRGGKERVDSTTLQDKIDSLHRRQTYTCFELISPHQYAITTQNIPIDLYIHYPNISANPSVVKLDQVCLGNTHKALVTVFNHTGYRVSFEIYKSLASEVLYIKPHYGDIEKSTGSNMSFVNIFIYFTPREARQYQESIRIVTNIPNYFLEIPIKATGTINEKFYVEYKI